MPIHPRSSSPTLLEKYSLSRRSSRHRQYQRQQDIKRLSIYLFSGRLWWTILKSFYGATEACKELINLNLPSTANQHRHRGGGSVLRKFHKMNSALLPQRHSRQIFQHFDFSWSFLLCSNVANFSQRVNFVIFWGYFLKKKFNLLLNKKLWRIWGGILNILYFLYLLQDFKNLLI